MTEIKQSAKYARRWRLFFGKNIGATHIDWCVSIGLYETSGWITKHGTRMLEWVKPDMYRDI